MNAPLEEFYYLEANNELVIFDCRIRMRDFLRAGAIGSWALVVSRG